MTRPRLRQDRSRRSGNRQSANCQDYPPLALTPAERAAWKFCNVVALLADSGPQYDNLPPAARMATDAAKHAAALLEPLLKAKGG